MRCNSLLATSLLVLATPLSAQAFYTYPEGTKNEWGGTGNTIPFWGGSATYQQVFDYAPMAAINGGNIIVMTQMFFRARGNILARSATVQMQFNHTSVTAANATTTFASNLQGPNDPAPTTVIASKAMSFPTFHGAAGPSVSGGMDFPLDTSFLWTPNLNKSFVLELRYKDGLPGSQNGQLDAVDGNSFTSTRRPSEGVGCIASDRSTAASAMSTLAFASGSSSFPAWNYTVSLADGRANANALWTFGLSRQTLTLPGGCASLLVNPLHTQFGATSASTGGSKPQPGGGWTLMIPVPQQPDLRSVPRFEVLSQFAWDDPGLPYGIGLSPMTVVQSNFPGAIAVSRIYAITTTAGNGMELATTGSKTTGYGLVTGFR